MHLFAHILRQGTMKGKSGSLSLELLEMVAIDTRNSRAFSLIFHHRQPIHKTVEELYRGKVHCKALFQPAGDKQLG